MKYDGGRTIQCSKNGDIAYESLANKAHIVGKKELPDEERVKAVKFEERFRKRKQIPINHLSELEELRDFTPFKFKNGMDKYVFYDFTPWEIANLTPKKRSLVVSLLELANRRGMIRAYKKHNKSKHLSSALKGFINGEIDLNQMWKESINNFLTGGDSGNK